VASQDLSILSEAAPVLLSHFTQVAPPDIEECRGLPIGKLPGQAINAYECLQALLTPSTQGQELAIFQHEQACEMVARSRGSLWSWTAFFLSITLRTENTVPESLSMWQKCCCLINSIKHDSLRCEAAVTVLLSLFVAEASRHTRGREMHRAFAAAHGATFNTAFELTWLMLVISTSQKPEDDTIRRVISSHATDISYVAFARLDEHPLDSGAVWNSVNLELQLVCIMLRLSISDTNGKFSLPTLLDLPSLRSILRIYKAVVAARSISTIVRTSVVQMCTFYLQVLTIKPESGSRLAPLTKDGLLVALARTYAAWLGSPSRLVPWEFSVGSCASRLQHFFEDVLLGRIWNMVIFRALLNACADTRLVGIPDTANWLAQIRELLMKYRGLLPRADRAELCSFSEASTNQRLFTLMGCANYHPVSHIGPFNRFHSRI
jgi:hypothetical protein